jgi:outer membrane lipoprotein-sorting protein
VNAMTTISRTSVLPLLGVLLVLLTGASVAGAQVEARTGDPDEIRRVMNGLRSRWSTMEGMACRFVHTFEWVLAGTTQSTQGRLWLGGRDRFRIETTERVMVSDGRLLWDHDLRQNQVIINQVDPERGVVTQQHLFVAYTEEVEVEWRGEERDERGRLQTMTLRLTRGPQADPPVVQVKVDIERMLVTLVEYADPAGNRNRYDLEEISLGRVAPERFQFTIPPGARAVDLRPPPRGDHR